MFFIAPSIQKLYGISQELSSTSTAVCDTRYAERNVNLENAYIGMKVNINPYNFISLQSEVNDHACRDLQLPFVSPRDKRVPVLIQACLPDSPGGR